MFRSLRVSFQAPRVGAAPSRRTAGVDQLELAPAHATMLRWIVPRVPPPERRDQKGRRRREGKRRPPAQGLHDPADDRPGGGGTQRQPGVGQPVGQRPAGGRKPVGDDLAGEHGKEWSLGHTHQETEPDENGQDDHGRSHRRRGHQPDQEVQRPPEARDDGQGTAPADQVPEDAAGKLEQAIPPGEGAQHPSELDLGEAEVRHHGRAGDREVGPEEITHEAYQAQQGEDLPPHMGGPAAGLRGRRRIHRWAADFDGADGAAVS
jgi:hypothetical protein